MGIFGGFIRKIGSAAKKVGTAVVSGVKKVGTAVTNGVKNVAARVSGKDKYEEAQRLYDEISKRYNEKREHFQKEIERITALIEEHVKSINDSKRMIKMELLPAMVNKISKIKDIRISDEYSVEEYIESVLNVDSIRSREQLFTIDFNAHKVKTTFQAIFTLGFYTRKKAKETFDFVLKTVGKDSFLGEQVDNSTLKTNWVIGLGWSHAMFIIVLEKLFSVR